MIRFFRWVYEGHKAMIDLDIALFEYSLDNSKNIWGALFLYMKLGTIRDLCLAYHVLPKWLGGKRD